MNLACLIELDSQQKNIEKTVRLSTMTFLRFFRKGGTKNVEQ